VKGLKKMENEGLVGELRRKLRLIKITYLELKLGGIKRAFYERKVKTGGGSAHVWDVYRGIRLDFYRKWAE